MATSEYFLLSLVLAFLGRRQTIDYKWAEIAKGVLPNLAGFSIAAYAIFFVILDEKARSALRQPSQKLGGKSPLLILISSISHAVIMQISAIILAIIIPVGTFPPINAFPSVGPIINGFISFMGLLFTIYAIVLVIATVLSLYKIFEITTKN